jgi:hypothetical protein
MKLFSQYDRFELEQDIIKMWNTSEYLKEFVRQYMDSPKIMGEDEVANYVDGIMRVHQLQCERLWNGFEQMIKHGHFAAWNKQAFPDVDVPVKKKGKKND